MTGHSISFRQGKKMDSMKNGKRCDASELVFFFVGFRSLLGHIKRNSKLFLVRNIRRKKKIFGSNWRH